MEEPEKNYGSMGGQANQLGVLRHGLKSRAAYQPPHNVSSGNSLGRGSRSGCTPFPEFAVARRRPAKDPTDQASVDAWYATLVPAGCMIPGQAGPGGTRGSMDGRRRSFHDPRKLRLARGCPFIEGGVGSEERRCRCEPDVHSSAPVVRSRICTSGTSLGTNTCPDFGCWIGRDVGSGSGAG